MSHTSHAGAVSVDERRISTPHGAIFVREARPVTGRPWC
jgi:hypothetical protein